jgi:hypothetical protein
MDSEKKTEQTMNSASVESAEGGLGAEEGIEEEEKSPHKFTRNSFAQRKQSFAAGLKENFAPLFMEQDALSGKSVPNVGKMLAWTTGLVVAVLGVGAAAGINYKLTNTQNEAAKMAATPPEIDPPKPSVDLVPPEPMTPKEASKAQERVRAVNQRVMQRPQGPTAEELMRRKRQAALARVQMRGANTAPVGGAQDRPLPPMAAVPNLPPGSQIFRSPQPIPASYRNFPAQAPISPYRVSPVGLPSTPPSYGAQGYLPVSYGGQSPAQTQRGLVTTQNFSEANGGAPLSQEQGGDVVPGQGNSARLLKGGVNRWSVIPPNNMIAARTKNTIQLLGAEKGTLVLAQVQGAVKVDGSPVVPDGALLQGEVTGVDAHTHRVTIEFNSISFGPLTLPLSGAKAFAVQGDGVQEGLVAQATGSPDYLGSDVASAVGSGAAEYANSIGQRTTYQGSGPLGGYGTTIQDGDPDTAARRAGARAISSVFTRQTRRSDQNTNKLEQRGPIFVIPSNQNFVIWLTQGL